MLKKLRVMQILVFAMIGLLLLTACASQQTPSAPAAPSGSSAPAAPSAAKKPPIKIATMVPKTGAVADWGKAEEIAAQMWVDEVNQAGGINGSKIELIVADSGGDPTQAVTLARRFATENKVFAIIGPLYSAEAKTAFPIANQLQVAIISSYANQPGLSEQPANRPWTFQYVSDIGWMDWAFQTIKAKFPDAKTAALIVDAGQDGTKVQLGAMKAGIKDNFQILNMDSPIEWKRGDTDLSVQATKIKAMKPDFLISSSTYLETALFSKELQRLGVKILGFGANGIQNDALLNSGGDAVNGWIGTSLWTADKPEIKAYIAKFTEAAKKSSFTLPASAVDAQHYLVLKRLGDIMTKSGIDGATDLTEARTKIRDGWANLGAFEDMLGPGKMNKDGKVERMPNLLIVKDGKWQLLASP